MNDPIWNLSRSTELDCDRKPIEFLLVFKTGGKRKSFHERKIFGHLRFKFFFDRRAVVWKFSVVLR